jgi:hypothetical protein
VRELSKTTLLGRVHQQASLEESHEVEALYQFIDPAIRARREREREDEPELTLSELREFVSKVETAQVEEVEILEARKVSPRHAGRPAALVQSVIRYNHEAEPQRFRTTWVKEGDTWYSTGVGRKR